ncbi:MULTISPECIES: LPS translocon maturation chaperone LptM [Achromobacter]|uniref:LPS translocon maturation chaperone LptM n=1 Tax=Achromobacter TaxID=222 RepID=UPI0028AFEFF3|nr:lipoprotein [Achromobacter sp.]
MALRIVATLMATGIVAACGYKGPLYMPPPPEGKAPASTQQTAPPTQIPPAPALP